MKSLARSPHHLVRNAHSYCFRINVPKDLQRTIGKKELRYSLKTGYVGIARVKAQMIAAQVHRIFDRLRKGGKKLTELTDDKIQELVQQYLKEYVRGLETRHFEDDSPIVTREDF
jgi:Glu-tRNA(Gln) amidotransferase subunit E-like FAD-binding protein